MEKISACTLDCQDSCSTVVKVDPENGRVRITGNPDHPFTRGFICKKGKNTYQRNTSEQRITTPLIRKGDNFLPTDWDTALDLVAEKLKALSKEPASILHVRHYGYRGFFADASKYLFNALGASSTRGALCDDAGCAAYMADFGGLEINDPQDLLNADHIINWGKDFSRSSIHLAQIINQAKKRGCHITTISPGADGNHALSDKVIRIRPGRDRFLAAGVIKEILKRGLAHGPALSQANGMGPLMEILARHSQEELLAACDCSREDLIHLLQVFTKDKANAPPIGEDICMAPDTGQTSRMSGMEANNTQRQPVALIMGWGIQRYHFGGETVRYLNALSFLSGHVGRSGGGTYYNISSGRNLNSDWVERAGQPARTLLLPRIGQEILTAQPPIKFLLADGSNFINQAPDSHTTLTAMEQIPFKVVIDAFLTDTAAQADVILPCALDHEREEIVGSCLHNFVNRSTPVFPPAGEALNDFEIMSRLALRMGISFPDKASLLKEALDTPHIKDPVTALEEIKTKGFIKASHPKIAWQGLCFAHADGKYRLPTSLSPESLPPQGFPMHLLSLVNGDYIHSQIPESDQTSPENDLLCVWINEFSFHLNGIDLTKQVFLATALGRMPVRVKKTSHLHPGTLIIRRGGWLKYSRCVNALIEPAITDMGETAAYYSQYARLEN